MSCEYGVIKQNSIYCNLINDNCTFVRWCYNSQCIKNTYGYTNCKFRSEEMSKKNKNDTENVEFTLNEEIIEVDSASEYIESGEYIYNKIKYKEEICEILWVKPTCFAIDFKGYGISFHVKDGHILDTDKINNNFIKVRYESNIGNSDFKIFPCYEG